MTSVSKKKKRVACEFKIDDYEVLKQASEEELKPMGQIIRESTMFVLKWRSGKKGEKRFKTPNVKVDPISEMPF